MLRQPYELLDEPNDNELLDDSDVAIIELQEAPKLGHRSATVTDEIEEYQEVSLLNSRQNGTHKKWKPSFSLLCGTEACASKYVAAILFVLVLGLIATVVALIMRGNASDGHSGTVSIEVIDRAEGLQESTFPIMVDYSRARCNNNGMFDFVDGVCSCSDCYAGPTCAQELALGDCIINAESGTPLIFEEYWVAHPVAEMRIRASDHLGYLRGQFKRLEDAIRRLHAMAGNAVTEGREIVVGSGSTDLINAAYYAFADRNASAPLLGYAEAPYYGAYGILADYWQSSLFQWHRGDTPPDATQQRVLQFITSPNNPDGRWNNKTLQGAYGVYDHAYYWPHFTPITHAVQYDDDKDIALFTLSKLTGHAGSRVGWAVVKDKALADRMRMHVDTHLLANENQQRAINILDYVIATHGDIFSFAATEMRRRWDELQQIFSGLQRFKIQALEPAAYDRWFNSERSPSPAYLWLHCLDHVQAANCTSTMETAGIIGRAGGKFGMAGWYVRLELLMNARSFDHMARNLRKLVGM